MREILFRGRSLKRDEWFYGDFQYHNGMNPHKGYIQHRIPHPVKELNPTCHLYSVDVETIGQYTGLTDKNGKKIFEGDIIKLDDMVGTERKNFEVKFAYGQFYIGLNKPVVYVRCQCEVIGNIHDNPESLERT